MSKTENKVTKRRFTALLVVIFSSTFLALGSYLSYQVRGTKVELFKLRNAKHSVKVRARIVNSYEGISELNEAKYAFDNYGLIRKNQPSELVYGNAIEHKTIASSQPNTDQFREQVLSPNQGTIQMKPIGLSSIQNSIGLAKETLLSNNKAFDYVQTPSKLYAGIWAAPVFGLKNYYNANSLKAYSTELFANYIGSDLLEYKESMVIGMGVAAYGGYALNNQLSFEAGVSFTNLSGDAKYNYAHTFKEKIEFVEWIVSGEDEALTIASNDYVQKTVSDTIRSTFNVNALAVPVNVVYSIGQGRLRPFAALGVTFNYILGGERNLNSSLQNQEIIFEEQNGLSQVSASIGVGLDYKISTNLNLRIKPNYEAGLWNNHSTFANGNQHALSVQTGLLYNF